MTAPAEQAPPATRGSSRLSIGLLITALLVAAVLSYFASSAPDGLERVAEDEGFIDSAQEHATGSGPLADYATSGVTNDWLSVAIAGSTGVIVTAALAGALFILLRRRRTSPRK